MIAGTQAFIAVAVVAFIAGLHLDAVQLAHTALAVMAAAFHRAMDALVLVFERHHFPPPFPVMVTG